MENNIKTGMDKFGGWSSNEDLFAMSENNKETEVKSEDTNKPENKPEENTSNTKQVPEVIDGEQGENLFDVIDEHDSKQEKEEQQEEVEEPEKESKEIPIELSTVNLLREKGFLDITDDELEGDIDELLETKFDEKVENTISNLFNNLPDVVKQINKYALKGGDINVFLNSLVDNRLNKNIDLEKPSDQELVVRQYLKEIGNDPEDIDSQIEYYKSTNKLESLAKNKYSKWQENQKNKKEELIKKQEEINRKQNEELRASRQRIVNFLSDNNNIGNIKFTRKDKKSLPSYMNDKIISLNNGVQISRLQKELFYDVPNNEKAFIQLAVLMQHRNSDGTFNFDDIIKDTKTKVANKVKKDVRRNNTDIPNKTKQPGYTGKYLADYFD